MVDMSVEIIDRMALRGPTISNLVRLHSMPVCTHTFRLMFRRLPQLMLQRAIVGIKRLCGPRQRIVLRLCALYLLDVPVWPAEHCLANTWTRHLAAGVVKVMPVHLQLGLLPVLAGSQCRAGNEVILELSTQSPYAARVAEVLSATTRPLPILEYVCYRALVHMIPYLMQHAMYRELITVLRQYPVRAIQAGVFTFLAEHGQQPFSFFVPHLMPIFGACPHVAIYRMFCQDVPTMLSVCHEQQPAGLRAIVRMCPGVRADYNWWRRRYMVMGRDNRGGDSLSSRLHALDDTMWRLIVVYV